MAKIDLGRVVGRDGSGGQIDVDDELSDTSTNPVQNRVVNNAIEDLKELIGRAEMILKEV